MCLSWSVSVLNADQFTRIISIMEEDALSLYFAQLGSA